jgi:hypothetical protein
MAMQRQRWSVNGLSVELGRDRRTVARYVDEVKPAGEGTHGPLYYMADAVRAIYEDDWRGHVALSAFASRLNEALHPERREPDEEEPLFASLDIPRRLCRATTVAAVERVLFEALLAFVFEERLAHDEGEERVELRACTNAQIRRAVEAYIDGRADLMEVYEGLRASDAKRRRPVSGSKASPVVGATV